MPTELEKKIINFNAEYDTKLSVNRLENTSSKKLQNLDDPLFEGNAENRALKKYVAGLTKTLAECIRAKIKINDLMDYDLSNMSILSFIREYEAIVKARKEETEYEAQRLPYEGADYKKLVKYVVESTKQFDQSLCWNWAESVLNQSLSIKDMKAVTNRAIADLDNLGGVEDFGDEEKNKLINVYLAMRAMEMVRQQRGFFFKIFSFRINRREKEYFNQLVAAKDRFIARGFPVAELRQEVYVSIMKPVYEDVEKRLASQERAKEAEKERQEKLRNLPKVVDALNPRMQDPALKSKVEPINQPSQHDAPVIGNNK